MRPYSPIRLLKLKLPENALKHGKATADIFTEYCPFAMISDTKQKMASSHGKGRFAPTGSLSGGLPVFHCEATPSQPEMYRWTLILKIWPSDFYLLLFKRGYKACSNVSDLSRNWPTKWTTTNQRAFQGKPVEQSAKWGLSWQLHDNLDVGVDNY